MNREEIENLKDDFENVQYRIEEEGIEYCFNGYSTWNVIEDEKFHKLRGNYLRASQEIIDYIDEKIIELNKLLD